MVYLRVQELLNERGKKRYWLVKRMQTDYPTVNKLCDGESTQIRFETLDKLTDIFECDFNTLFVKKPTNDEKC